MDGDGPGLRQEPADDLLNLLPVRASLEPGGGLFHHLAEILLRGSSCCGHDLAKTALELLIGKLRREVCLQDLELAALLLRQLGTISSRELIDGVQPLLDGLADQNQRLFVAQLASYLDLLIFDWPSGLIGAPGSSRFCKRNMACRLLD